jgi:undecaprenyl-diphosphatase
MKRLYPLFAHRRFRFWLMIVGIVIALVGFEEVADDVFYDPLEGDFEFREFDRSVTQWVSRFRSPVLNQVMIDLTALGSVSVVLTLFIVLASVLATYRDFRGLGYITIVLAGAGAWPLLLKSYFGRERPPEMDRLVEVASLSFPSGHSFGASAVYIGLAYYVTQYTRSWAHEVFFYCLGALLILVVGTTRIYLGAHFPTDVVAGLCGGIAWGLICASVFEFLGPAQRKFVKKKLGTNQVPRSKPHSSDGHDR